MERRYYKDYFSVPIDYKANMTREAINETPETWLNFYPHAKYLEFLYALFDESKSVWLTGNYGTGKSNAALVTHKLFMDDKERVEKWFDQNAKVIPNIDSVKKRLFEERDKGVLVVYDYNASGIGPNEEFLVRLEKGIFAALKANMLAAPAKAANLDLVIERLKREGSNFFTTRDQMLDEMKSLRKEINSIDQLVSKLKEESESKTPTHYLEDVQAVFHKDSIFLSIDVPNFREWISGICRENNLRRIIYIFDEFSEFIDNNSGMLKTFEDVTEAPATNHFYLVPVTHKELTAFYGENSPGAKKARDRFYFRNLQMPNDIAFKLAEFAMKPNQDPSVREEWDAAKMTLWSSIRSVVDKFNDPPDSAAYVDRKSFYGILPIQPMTAFLLKFLAESARSNQRSIFEYLKGSADGREFQDFISSGGPDIQNKQFLTADYLWKYFMERDDSGQSKEITTIKMEYDRIENREFKNHPEDSPEIRVLRTVFLFALLSRLNPDGHDRLRPTVENIDLCYRGDGVVLNVDSILRDMSENRHCFSIVNGVIDLYSTSVGGDELNKKKEEFQGQFYELLVPACKTKFESQIKTARRGFSNDRFEIRVTDYQHANQTNISTSTRERFGTDLNKDDGSVCLWFVVAKNRDDQLQIQEREEKLLTNLKDHRIVMISFPEVTFCEKNLSLWDEYVTLRAQHFLENNSSAKDQLEKSFKKIETEWIDILTKQNNALEIRYFDKQIDSIRNEKYSWSSLNQFLKNYVMIELPGCPDNITEQISAYSNAGLKLWALAGIRFSGSSQQGQLVNALVSNGVSSDDTWFSSNPTHVLSRIHALLKKKYDNTVGNGNNFSVRKAYIELQRAPFGMRYNCLSAFTLGFCLKWVLKNGVQWTNEQIQKTLDEDTLAEIIEQTVSGKTDKEKLICRLSKEAKSFAAKAGLMFGLPQIDNTDPNETLRSIAARVEADSMKVPLWILADYIRNESPSNEVAATVLDKLCVTLRISSKGSTTDKAVAISEIGHILLEDSSVIDVVKSYSKPEIYMRAFYSYVDSVNPELKEIAKNVEDLGHAYCKMILEKTARVSGWLWNKADISSVIEQVFYSYKVISLGRTLLKLSGYASYEEILTRLIQKTKKLGLPYSVISDRYTGIAEILDGLTNGKEPKSLYKSIQDSYSEFEGLYNDPSKSRALSLLRELIDEKDLDNSELLSILSEIQNYSEYSVNMPVDAFCKLVRDELSRNHRNNLTLKVKEEWKRITGFSSISEWSQECKLPVWTALYGIPDKNGIISALDSPEQLSDKALADKCEVLISVPPVSITKCQEVFKERAIPKRYRKLNLDLASLLSYLSKPEVYGSDPNKWPENLDIESFIVNQYQQVFAPGILSQIRNMDAECLKKELIEMAKTDPDIGLRFLGK